MDIHYWFVVFIFFEFALTVKIAFPRKVKQQKKSAVGYSEAILTRGLGVQPPEIILFKSWHYCLAAAAASSAFFACFSRMRCASRSIRCSFVIPLLASYTQITINLTLSLCNFLVLIENLNTRTCYRHINGKLINAYKSYFYV